MTTGDRPPGVESHLGGKARLRAALLALPVLIFLGVTYVAPIVTLMVQSVYDSVVAEAMPETLAQLETWDGQGLPPEAAYAAAASEMRKALDDRSLARVAGRISRVRGDLRRAVIVTARGLEGVTEGPWRDAMIAIDDAWARTTTWNAIRETGQRFTARHYLNVVRAQTLPGGSVSDQTEGRRIYLWLLGRTVVVSAIITMLCMVLGFPIAHLIVRAPRHQRKWLFVLVLAPFWISLLVRTASWMVLLPTQGVLNDVLVVFGLVDDDGRLVLMYNVFGTIITTTNALLPFMILPLFGVMNRIPRHQTVTAVALGAGRVKSFIKVYLPQVLPGVGAGVLMVFAISVGYHITPALVGGTDGQLVSVQIAHHMQTSLDWGLAAALSVVLIAGVLALFLLYNRLVGFERSRATLSHDVALPDPRWWKAK